MINHTKQKPPPKTGEAENLDAATETSTAEASLAEQYRQTKDETMRLAKRYRRQAMPFAAIGGTHAIGGFAASLAGPEALLPVLAGSCLAGGGYLYARKRAPRWDRAYTAVAAAASSGAQLLMAATGADGLNACLLWGVGCVLAAPWWKRHAEPDPDTEAELANPAPKRQPPKQDAPPDPRAVAWGKYLGSGKLHRSRIYDIEEFAFGWTATVELRTGEHWRSILQARDAILSTYDLPDGRVFIEPIPGESVRRAKLTVLTNDPLKTVRYWDGPSLDISEGGFPLMSTADGETLLWRFWSPGQGSLHGLVSGATGVGKSKILDLILAEACASDRIYPVVIDGGGGASLPHWMNRVPRSADNPHDAPRLLRWALKVMEARAQLVKKQGGGSLEPSPEIPLIAIVIDEAHKLLMSDALSGDDKRAKEFRRMCEKIAQEGRKFGVSLTLATQVPSAEQLGGSTVLRDQLRSGTIVALRVNEGTTDTMITSGAPMPEKLNQLPRFFDDGSETRGLGYMLTHRLIRARSLLITTEDVETVPVTPVELDSISASASAPAEQDGAPGSARPGPSLSSEDAIAAVEQAIAGGTSTDVSALMQATGLPLGAVRRALAQRN